MSLEYLNFDESFLKSFPVLSVSMMETFMNSYGRVHRWNHSTKMSPLKAMR